MPASGNLNLPRVAYKWTPAQVREWLTAWRVEPGVANALKGAGVDGRRLQDLVHAPASDPTPWEAVGVLSEKDQEAVRAACEYLASRSWVVARWVRG